MHQFSSDPQSYMTLCDPKDCSTPGLPVHHNSQSLLKVMSMELVMPSNHLICWTLLFPPSIFPSIQVFSNESALHIRWPKYWSFNSADVFSSVQFSHSVVSDSLWPHESQHARPPCPSPTPRVYPNPCPSSRWCHPAISSGWISLQSKGLSRVFSNTTVQKHQFFSAQLSSQSNSHIHTWLLEKP